VHAAAELVVAGEIGACGGEAAALALQLLLAGGDLGGAAAREVDNSPMYASLRRIRQMVE